VAQTHQRLLSHSIRLLNRQALRDHPVTPFYHFGIFLSVHPGSSSRVGVTINYHIVISSISQPVGFGAVPLSKSHGTLYQLPITKGVSHQGQTPSTLGAIDFCRRKARLSNLWSTLPAKQTTPMTRLGGMLHQTCQILFPTSRHKTGTRWPIHDVCWLG
jgi:hypothetical protein